MRQEDETHCEGQHESGEVDNGALSAESLGRQSVCHRLVSL
jgi:hypothetical protein